MRKRYSLGLDYGTNSCRAVIVDLDDGGEVATHVYAYPSGEQGILVDGRDPNVARQNPADYISGLTTMVPAAIRKARAADRRFSAEGIIGIGVDTTGSTPIPVDRSGTPLALSSRFARNQNAMAWLWKDHTGHAEAAEITELARKMRPQYLAKCGGTYSSEWFWSKILHCRRTDSAVFRAAYSFVEHCDWMPALLVGETRPERMMRSVCAAGHKAMYSRSWGGLPDESFLRRLDPELALLRKRLYSEAVPSNQRAGGLTREWAGRLGLKPGVSVAVGAFDAHMGAVGAGIREGVLVKILGTSTCDMMVRRNTKRLADIPGVCGIVDGSILPGYFGIEAGQSAVGDIFLWFVNSLVPASYGRNQDEMFRKLAAEAARMKPGEHGLLALDWNNGNRTVLVDPRLCGLLIGQTLHTKAHEVYRALIEATAFGALTIVNRIKEYGVPVREIVNCGGLAVKNHLLMQIYADITGCTMKVAASDQTCAVGAAIFGAVAAGRRNGGFACAEDAQACISSLRAKVYRPVPSAHKVYMELYKLYRELHDAFGTETWKGRMNHVMKKLIAIREQQRQ